MMTVAAVEERLSLTSRSEERPLPRAADTAIIINDDSSGSSMDVGQTDGRTDGRTDGWTVKRTKKRQWRRERWPFDVSQAT